jgi:hypothetical protein
MLLTGQLPEQSFASVAFWQLVIYIDLEFYMEVKILLCLPWVNLFTKNVNFHSFPSNDMYVTCPDTII